MKVVILAAGKGTRMLPLTEKVPKVLVEINNKPFLYYLIKNLMKAGYSDFGIVVGYKKEQVKDFLKRYGFKAELIVEEELLGTGHAVKTAEGFVNNENFVVASGDNLWHPDDLKRFGINDQLNYIGAITVENPEKYGILVTENIITKNIATENPATGNIVTENVVATENNLETDLKTDLNNDFLKYIIEKPKREDAPSRLANTGLYKFTPEIFKMLNLLKKSEQENHQKGEYFLTDAITMLAKEKKVKVIKLKHKWIDLGSKEDIPVVEKNIKSLIINSG